LELGPRGVVVVVVVVAAAVFCVVAVMQRAPQQEKAFGSRFLSSPEDDFGARSVRTLFGAGHS
jgi:hypothetical protein